MKFKNIHLIPASGKIDNQFVGIKILNNEIEFHYPETYNLDTRNEKQLRKEIVSILRTVSLAKTISNDKSSYYSRHNENYVFPLKSFLWIINDYLINGKYQNREKIFVKGIKGKVNWKKTMQSQPIISGGNIIYTNIVSERKNNIDDMLTEIYFFCVQKAVDSLGWLYDIKFENQGLDYYKLYNQKKYLSVINDELSHSYDDNKKIRLNNMKNIIIGLDDSMVQTKDIVFGVDSYDYVYEKMIDMMFSKVKNKKDFYPSATWSLVIDNSEINSTNLRPDTIMIKSNRLYILDAKYYRYGTTFNPRDLPETTSIQKQITYGEYIKKVKSGQYDDVFSAFIMPYNKYNNIKQSKFNQDIEFIGTATAKWIDANENNRKIAGILIDTKFLVDNISKGSDSTINDLVEMIDKNIGGVTNE